MQEIILNAPSATATIYVGDDVLEKRLPLLLQGQNNFVLTDSNVYALYPEIFEKYFSNVETFILPAGEEHKNLQSLYDILTKMSESGLLRNSRLFAIGGGVIGDIGGLASALYMRGITCVQIPTTLLAQVDSSVGGKTAVDLGEKKNIVGAFHQPSEVLVAPFFLKTLPIREIKCGLGEIVKYCALNGEIFDSLENHHGDWTDLAFLTGLITACIAHKARVVEMDEKETGERKSLNVGHTTGHAIELRYQFSHGEGVMYGMLLETQMAMETGVCERAYGEKLLQIIRKALSIAPTSTPDFFDIQACATLAKSDKKNTDVQTITLAVAKSKNEWALMNMPFEAYANALQRLANQEKAVNKICK